MPTITPVLTDANTKLAAGFDVIDDKLFTLFTTKSQQDCITLKSNATSDILVYQSALLYVHIIYMDIVNPYTTVLTLDQYKDKYKYHTYLEAFQKVNVPLKDIFDAYDFPTLISSL